jgi:hypothetical protein
VTVDESALEELASLLANFAQASAQNYGTPDVAVHALAGRARALKLALISVGRPGSGAHLGQLESDFKALLFKNGLPFTWERFVDSYVQLAVFGALLWRLESKSDISLDRQVGVSSGLHPLLSQCLVILWSPQSRIPILEPLLEELCLTINHIDPAMFTPPAVPRAGVVGKRRYIPDPIVHAYEPFFSAYDPAARETSGVYYTPVEIVEHMVSGVRALLRDSMGKADGLLDTDARFLDPATGTGTFLLGLANGVASEAADQGLPIDTMVEQVLTRQTSAFEIFPGPYTIAHQRLEVALESFGAKILGRLPIYLADTLEAPATGTLGGSGFGLAGREIQKERENADRVKTAEEILVILGNPPYERVLENQGGQFEAFAQGLLREIYRRTPLSHKRDLKSTKDLFVAFWAWALWALQDPEYRAATAALPKIDTKRCHGLISFITNRTWIAGRSLIGLRAMILEGAKEIWILDLGGDSRGAHGAKSFAGGDANVFGIRTGVAISWIVFDRNHVGAPTLRYRRLFGNRRDKLTALADTFNEVEYETITPGPEEPFLPSGWGNSPLATAPRLSDLFSIEAETGIQSARDKSSYSPIGTEAVEVLSRAGDRLVGRLADWAQLGVRQRATAWATAQSSRARTAVPTPASLDPTRMRNFVYRPLDFRWIYADAAWVDWWRPNLQAVFSLGAVPTIVTLPGDHGNGPAAMHVEMLMDQHSFRGSDGGKGVYPLWIPHDEYAILHDSRTVVSGGRRCTFSGVVYGWLDRLGRGQSVEEAYNYLLAILSAPAYTRKSWKALEADSVRLPLSVKGEVFEEGARLGSELRTAWTLKVPRSPSVSWSGATTGQPLGSAAWMDGHVEFAGGRRLEGVTRDTWEFQISNYPVLKSWLDARSAWTLTPLQAKQAIAVVSSILRIRALEPALDLALAAAESSM